MCGTTTGGGIVLDRERILYVETSSLDQYPGLRHVSRFNDLRSSFHLDSGKPVYMRWSALSGLLQIDAVQGTGSWSEARAWTPGPAVVRKIVRDAGARRIQKVVLLPRWGGYRALRSEGGDDELSWHNFSEDFDAYDPERHMRVKSVVEFLADAYPDREKAGLPVVVMSDDEPDVFRVDIPPGTRAKNHDLVASWAFRARPDGTLMDWIRESERLG